MDSYSTRSLVALLLVACAACVAAEPTRTPPRATADVPRVLESIEAQAQTASAASRPRREHQAISVLAGRWSTRVVNVDASGVEHDPYPGQARIEAVFGGRYLRWEATLELGAETHATSGFLGFDLNQSEYQLLMISDLATGMGVARGRGDPHGKGIRFTIEVPDPATGALRRAVSLLRCQDADHFVLEQLGADASGAEHVARRTYYARAQAVSSN